MTRLEGRPAAWEERGLDLGSQLCWVECSNSLVDWPDEWGRLEGVFQKFFAQL